MQRVVGVCAKAREMVIGDAAMMSVFTHMPLLPHLLPQVCNPVGPLGVLLGVSGGAEGEEGGTSVCSGHQLVQAARPK